MAYLDGIKTGDKLWSIQLGECVVVDIDDSAQNPICVGSIGSPYVGQESYDYEGHHWESDKIPSLFWSKPEFKLPVKPKKKVKKTGWINIYNDGSTSNIYDSELRAKNNHNPNKILAARINVEYEVEE